MILIIAPLDVLCFLPSPVYVGLEFVGVFRVITNDLVYICQRDRWILAGDLFSGSPILKGGNQGFQRNPRTGWAHVPNKGEISKQTQLAAFEGVIRQDSKAGIRCLAVRVERLSREFSS